jgi:hypothetical protein
MSEWIPLMDYAMKKGVSLSTLRRHIKANKVQYRVENGRYLLFVEKSDPALANRAPSTSAAQASGGSHGASSTANKSVGRDDDFLVSQLQIKLKKAQEEIAELKTLIAFYEESLGFAKTAPATVAPALNRFDG